MRGGIPMSTPHPQRKPAQGFLHSHPAHSSPLSPQGRGEKTAYGEEEGRKRRQRQGKGSGEKKAYKKICKIMLYTIIIKNDFTTNIRADFIEKTVFFAIFSFFSDIIIPIIADETKIEMELPNKYSVTSSQMLGFFSLTKDYW